MKIIDWYILKKFFLTFFFFLIALTVIVIIIDLSEKTDEIEYENSILEIEINIIINQNVKIKGTFSNIHEAVLLYI